MIRGGTGALLVAWTHLADRPVRTVLTIMGVALGVAVAIAMTMANREVLRSFEGAVQDIAGQATVQISGGDLGVDDMLIPALRADPDIVAVSPVVQRGGAIASGPHRGMTVVLVGIDLLEEQDVKGVRIHTASDRDDGASDVEVLLQSDTVLLGHRLAAELGLSQGMAVEVQAGLARHRLVVRGFVHTDGGVPSAWDMFLVMDIASAQALFGTAGRLDRIDIVTAPAVDVAAVTARLRVGLPPSVFVERPAQRTEQVERMMRAMKLNLQVLGGVGLLVGTLLVYNTAAFAVVRRRREIGVLRAIGMPRAAVLLVFLGQAAVWGVAGGLAGCLLGTVLAQGLVQLLARTVSDLYVAINATPGGIVVPPGDVWLSGLIIGSGVAGLGALVPSWDASRTDPARALAPGEYDAGQAAHAGRLAWIGAGSLLASYVFALPGPVVGLPLFGYASVLCLLAGLAALAPGLIAVVARLAARPQPAAHAGTPGGNMMRLAIGQVTQATGRSAVTVAALMVGIAIMVGVGTMIRSFRATVDEWVNQTVVADFVVAPAAWLRGTDSLAAGPRLPAAWAGELLAVPGVAAVDAYRQIRVQLGDRPASIVARDLSLHAERSRYLMLDGDSRETLDRAVREGGVVMSETLSRRLGIGAGGTVTVPTPSGLRQLPVIGVFYDYATDGGKVVMDRSLYDPLWGDDTATVFGVYRHTEADAVLVRRRIEQALERLAGAGEPIVVIRNADLKRDILAIFDRTFRVTYALEAIAVVIALLGIANTLLISIVERQRELATLRAIGASRAQIHRLVLCEAVVLAGLGTLLGLAGGGLLSVLLVEVINTQSFGWTIVLAWAPSLWAQAAGGAMLAAVLAGWVPARWAARREIVEGLRYE